LCSIEGLEDQRNFEGLAWLTASEDAAGLH